MGSQTRLWHCYHTKSPNLRHHQACSQNKGLSKASGCRPVHPPPETGRQRQPELEGGNQGPREGSSTKLQAGFIANQDFLGFWMVHICREGHSQKSAPQKRHMAHLRRRANCTSRKPSGWDRGGDKTHSPPGGDCTLQAPGHLNCLDLGRGHKMQDQPSLRLCEVSENLNLSGLDWRVHATQGQHQTVPGRAT